MAHSITLQTGETTVVDGDVLGRIGFAASAETGSEALKVVAKIEAVAEKTFDADENATEMVFYLAADGDAAAKMTLSSAGLLTPAGGITSTGAANTFGATSFNDANITNVGNIALDSISADASALSIDSNWDAAGVTCSDLGAVTTADINGGTIDGATIGGSSAGAGTFTSLDCTDGGFAIANLDIDGGTDIGEALVGADLIIVDNGAGGTNRKSTMTRVATFVLAQTASSVDIDGGAIDGTVIGANSAVAGTFAAIVGSSLSLGEGNITNVGDINCDSVSVDDAAVGLNIAFGGNTTLNKMTLTDNLADALNITEGSNSYIKFVTTDSAEKIVLGKSLVGATHTDGSGQDASLAIDCSKGNYQEILLGNADVTSVAFTNATAGQRIVVRFKNHSTAKDLHATAGWNSVTINGSSATLHWPGGTEPTLTDSNNAIDVYGFVFTSTVTTAYGFIMGQDIKA